MMLLPKKVGSFTLMRKLDADGTTEAYVGILDEPAGKQVVARRIPPPIARDAARMDRVKARIGDLMGVRHPSLVAVLDLVEADGDSWILEDWSDAVELRALIDHCARAGSSLPHNVYLNIATQICNGLEALHSRPGKESGGEHVLHMALSPSAVLLTPDGRVLLGGFGLARSPTTAGSTVTGTLGGAMEYLSPEQTHQDQKLSPASDIFSLGTILYELLTLKPMFRAESNLQTIHRVRRAEVTTQLLEVKELLPGLDKVLFRALSLNPRHRYQRAFVLREDLRGLMAGFSFADIEEVTVAFLAPVLRGARGGASDELVPSLGPDGPAESTAALLAGASPTPGIASRFEGGLEPDTGPRPRPLELDAVDTDPAPPDIDTDLGGGDTAWARRPSRPDASAPPLTRSPLADVDTSEGRFPEAEGEPTTGPLLDISTSMPIRGETLPMDDTAAYLRGSDTITSPGDHTLPFDLDQHTMPSARPEPVIVPAEPPPSTPHEVDTEPEPEPPPRAPEPSSQELSHRLQPASTLVPPESVRPMPRREQVALPTSPLEHEDDLHAPERPAWVPLAVGGAVLAAVVGVLVCLGAGGGMLGVLASGSPEQVAVAPDPAPPEPEPEPEPVAPEPEPEPEVVAAAAQPVRPAPPPVAPPPRPVRQTQPAPQPPRPAPALPPRPPPEPIREAPTPAETWDAVAMVDPTADVEPAGEVTADDLSAWSSDAFAGRLSPDAAQALAAVPADDPGFTRARTLLYLDAKSRGDESGRNEHLTLLMALPENHYNPVLLVEEAQYAVDLGDFSRAIERARTAEQHWARLPSDLIYSRKALIYEIQAVSHTGLFYASEGDDLEQLAQAIRGWERYRRHVGTKNRQDLLARADDHLEKLYAMQRRVQ